MAHDKLLQELDERRAKAAAMGGEEKLSKRHNRGQLNAWQRMEVLVDEGSFIETGLLGASSILKADEQRTPRDGKGVALRAPVWVSLAWCSRADLLRPFSGTGLRRRRGRTWYV